MKFLVLFFILGLSFERVLAAGEVVKTCQFLVKVPGNQQQIPTTYTILKSGNTFFAEGFQIVNGQKLQLKNEPVKISEMTVRPDLNTKIEGLNEAETLIASTAEMLMDSDFGSTFSVGLDLSRVRSAKLFQIGTPTHMGGTVLIEAKDAESKILGSFVTGFLPFACQRQ